MNFNKATVRLDHDDIIAAIREHVARRGWAVGDITISCSPHQYNGPDTYSATAEVEPAPCDHAGQTPSYQPPFGQRAACRSCRQPIRFNGTCWEHEVEKKPRHPAIPDLASTWMA